MNARHRTLFVAAALLAVPALAGCGLMRATFWPAKSDAAAEQPAAAPAPQPLRISYRIDAGQMGLPLAVSCVEAQQVSYEEVVAQPHAGRSIGVLDVQFPHPAGKPGVALVGVVIQRQQEPNRGVSPGWFRYVRGWFREPPEDEVAITTPRDLHEAWVLEISKEELHSLLVRLKASGFYDQPDRAEEGVVLSLTANGERLQKNWNHIPELDALMHRVRSQGQLISYQGTAAP